MEKKIKCYFVTEEEALGQVESDPTKTTTEECSAKIKTALYNKYIYCNRDDIVDFIRNEKNNKNLISGKKNEAYDEYIEYSFTSAYDTIIVIIPKQIKNEIENMKDPNAINYINQFDLIIESLENSKRVNRTRRIKKILAIATLVGTMAATIVKIKKENEEYKPIKPTNTYSEYYEGILTYNEYQEMIERLEKSIDKSNKETGKSK